MDSSWCLALHGMYNKPETIVLSKDSYERLYQENRFKQLFSHMTQSVRLLFLGFSFKDNSYVKNLVDSLGLLSATHYALVEYSNQHEKDTLEEALPFLSFQYYKPEFDNSQYSRRETVKRFISEIYSGMGPIIDPALGNEFEDAYRLFRRTTTVEKGIGKLYELEIRANGKQLPPKYSGYLMNARLREAFIRGDNDAIARFEKSIEGYSFTSTRYQLLISLGYYYINSGRYDKALEVLRECKQERPDAISPNLYCWCAEFKLGLLGNYENAIKEFVDDYGNITIDVSDDEKSNIFQIIGEMGLSNEATLADAEKFLNLALKFSPDAEIIEDLGFCYLKKVKYNFKKNHYVPTKELSVARAYFEEAMALCVDSIRRCYLRIAVAYLEVLEY
jgi:tetratricopeptide (TPR) repeat protein